MNPQRFREFLLVVALLASPAAIQAQSELNKPYELYIVVHVAQNRLLTNVFRERIERELHDGFQAGLGDMGHVTVAHEHPRLADVLARGLKQSLDSWKDRSGVKTHFVLIDFSGVHYEIQARQYDGTTGRPSPAVRHSRTRDRDFVAKAAALLLKQDFGILGIVRTAPDRQGQGEKVRIELRGGALGNLARWVQKGDIFALAPPGGGSPKVLNWALLQVEEPPAEDTRDGVCVCRFYHRYKVPNITGYPCIKLGTVQAALRLRWMQETPDNRLTTLKTDLSVDIRRHGFQGEEATLLGGRSTERGGVLETVDLGDKGVFSNVAFVSVTSDMAGTKPQIPIALVDDQPIVIGVNATQNPNMLLKVRKAAWQSEVSESLLVQVNLFKRLEVLGAEAAQRDKIIQEAERGLKRSRHDREDLMARRTDLLKEAKEKHVPLDTSREDKSLEEIAKGALALEQFLAEQKRIEEKENDPQRKKWLSEVERAKLLEQDLELGKAIDIYERIQKEGFQDAGLAKHLEELQKFWKPVNDEHKEARAFIYRVWPTLDTVQLAENMPKARKAFETCEKAHDIISIRKMFKGFEGHAERLVKELNELHPDINVEDDKPHQLRVKLKEELLKLGTEIQNNLSKAQPSS